MQGELIEQPSWGGRSIIDLKGLSDDQHWQGKKVGQSYEMAKAAHLHGGKRRGRWEPKPKAWVLGVGFIRSLRG